MTLLNVRTHTRTQEHSIVGQMVLRHVQTDLQGNRVNVTAGLAHRPAPSQALAFLSILTEQEPFCDD